MTWKSLPLGLILIALVVVGFAAAGYIWQHPGKHPGQAGEQNYEVSHFHDLLQLDSPLEYSINPEFPELLRRATGFDLAQGAVHLPNFLETSERASLIEVKTRYERPPVELRSLYLKRHTAMPKHLFVIFPGFGSSADKILGRDPKRDYHDTIGRQLFEKNNFDVLALDLISSPDMAGAINLRLTMMGFQLTGLQLRHACDVIAWVSRDNAYEDVTLYGLRFGGRLADMYGHLCDQPPDRVIVDGLPFPWREHVRQAALRNRLFQPIIFQYLDSFLAHSSFLDFFWHGDFERVYLLTVNDIKAIRETAGERILLKPFKGRAKVRMVRRRTEFPYADFTLLDAVLKRRTNSYETYAASFRQP